MNIQTKRIYEPVSRSDGMRILVDRLWPRGISKDAAEIELWTRELAPSDAIRKWYYKGGGTWSEFKKRYFKELADKADDVAALRKAIGRRKATFLFASKELRYNNAAALKAYLERK